MNIIKQKTIYVLIWNFTHCCEILNSEFYLFIEDKIIDKIYREKKQFLRFYLVFRFLKAGPQGI